MYCGNTEEPSDLSALKNPEQEVLPCCSAGVLLKQDNLCLLAEPMLLKQAHLMMFFTQGCFMIDTISTSFDTGEMMPKVGRKLFCGASQLHIIMCQHH
jgi:hypothetical protein